MAIRKASRSTAFPVKDSLYQLVPGQVCSIWESCQSENCYIRDDRVVCLVHWVNKVGVFVKGVHLALARSAAHPSPQSLDN